MSTANEESLYQAPARRSVLDVAFCSPRTSSVDDVQVWSITGPEEREVHAAIFTGLENGTLRPVVGKELPLAEAVQAHEDVMAPGAYGKIVLIP